MSLRLISAITFLAFVCMLTVPAFSFTKKKDKSAVFEVPTSGKIIDVKYHPEFDEWWVHCQEGDNIAIYTYEPRTRTWGKVLFAPKKPDDKVLKPDQVKEQEKARKPDEMETLPSRQEEKAEDQRSGLPKKDQEKDQKKPDRKWWDPLNILKGPDKPKPEGQR